MKVPALVTKRINNTKLICDRLMRAQRGEYQNLLINLPPRALKSTIISVAFTAWLLGHNPMVACFKFCVYIDNNSETF